MKTKILFTATVCIVALFSVDLAYGRWPTIDPKAERHYSISPYAFTSNNPVNKVDPDGQDDFYFNKNGEMVERTTNDQPDMFYHREVHSKPVYTKTFTADGTATIEKSFVDVTTNTQIDMDGDLGHMIRTVYAEAGNQSSETKLAVAEVIRNRADDTTPNNAAAGWNAVFSDVNTYTEVVTQPGKFQSVGDNVPAYSDPASLTRPNGRRNEIETNAFVNSVGVSINATKNNTNTAQGATYFFDTSITTPGWAKTMQQVTIPNGGNKMKFYRY